MLKDGKILLGKAEDKEIYLLPHQMNRHGIITGASGTGKTITLKVIAESLSELGVPTFIADIKSDLSGMIQEGDISAIQERLDSMGIEGFKTNSYPVHFFDVYRDKGHPIRTNLQDMDPVLLSRILNLTDAQSGILNIIYRVAAELDPDGDGMGVEINDLKDLQMMTQYVGDNAKEITTNYGNVSKQSIGAIQRRLLELEEQQGDLLFGLPPINIEDFIVCENGKGVMNILECEQLFQRPLTYATFMLWLLDSLYKGLPEVGDLEKPKIVFFFDEAHLLFRDAPRQLLDKIEMIVKLIRSKGVGIFFCSQSPSDIPDTILAQLSNRIQHALRAYTPSEMNTVKKAAQAFRENPNLNTEEEICNMKTGTALVSVLDEEGAPNIVEKTKILPPCSSMGMASLDKIQSVIASDGLGAKYDQDRDIISAYEYLPEYMQEKEEERELAKAEEARKKYEEREALRNQNRLAKKVRNRAENALINMGIRSAKKLLKSLLK